MQAISESTRGEQQREVSSAMRRLITGSRTLLEAALEREGITLAQLKMLNALQENPQASAAELARLCYVTPQSMQAAVTRAEQQGWIQRDPSASNRRILSTRLTRNGKQILKRAGARWTAIERQLWAGTDAQDLQALHDTLRQALLQMQNMLDGGAPRVPRKRKPA